jgi:carbonic anhydrase
MRRALALLFLFAPLTAFAQTGCPASFDYSGFAPPSQWQYIADWKCATGPQSPINISEPFTPDHGKEIAVHYPNMKLTVANSGYDFRVLPTVSGWITFPGVERAVLVQFHFHVPSEHTFNGQPQTAGEIHFLNVDAVTGKRYVIAVLLRADTAENPALQPIINQLPLHLCEKKVTNLEYVSFLPPKITAYYRYVGSLTTPKCDGDVTFFVLPQLMPIGPNQLKALHQFGENARPPQPRGTNRQIWKVTP